MLQLVNASLHVRRLLLTLAIIVGLAAGLPTPASALDGSVIAGTVLDEASERPLSVEVQLELSQNGVVLETVSPDPADGSFSLDFLAAGSYQLELLVPEPDDLVVGGAVKTVAVSEFQTTHVDFRTVGIETMVLVSGRIFDDVDDSGDWSPGDKGIENSLSITGGGSPWPRSDENGYFEVLIAPGPGIRISSTPHYRYEFPFILNQSHPLGGTTDTFNYIVDLSGVSDAPNFDFITKAKPAVDLSVVPVSDTTGFPIAGAATVDLYLDGAMVNSVDKPATTDRVRFGLTDPGSYEVRVTVEGVTEISAIEVLTDPYNPVIDAPVDFLSKAKVSGVVFEDLNDNGVKDDGEPSFDTSNVLRASYDESGETRSDAFAKADGIHYKFLIPGVTYELTAGPPYGYELHALNSDAPAGVAGETSYTGVTVDYGEDLSGFDVAIKPEAGEPPEFTGSISLQILDADTEIPIKYIAFRLFQEGVTTHYSTWVGQGQFEFKNLAPGTYDISAAYAPAPFEHSITVGENEAVVETIYVSGNPRLGVVQGSVYNDENLNGTREAGEAGIAGVDLTSVSSIHPDRPVVVTTDENGYYRVPVESGGETTITQTQPDGWSDGAEAESVPIGEVQQDAYANLAVPAGQILNGYNFAEFIDETPPTIEHSPTDGTLLAFGDPAAVAFTCADTGGSLVASCLATLDGAEIEDGHAIDTEATGEHVLVVTAIDGSGNTTVETSTFTVDDAPDTDAPIITLEPADDSVVRFGSDAAVTFTCSDSGGSQIHSCTATLNGASVVSGTIIDSKTPGSHSVVVTATDGAGNVSVKSSTFTVAERPIIDEAESVVEIVEATDFNNGSHSEVLRLYQAIFGRYPDLGGAKYWIDINDDGHSILDIAGYMTGTKEWGNHYAGTTDADFVAKVYANVLGRAYDQEGYDYWLGLVTSGQLTRHEMVFYVTANAEFTRQYPFTQE